MLPLLTQGLSRALGVGSLAVLAASLLGAAPAWATARSTISYTCQAGGLSPITEFDTVETDFAASAGCDVSVTETQGTSDAIAHGLTTFGFPTAADAQTAIMVNGGRRATSRLTAQVRFNVTVAPVALPPIGPAEIPIKITAPYSLNVSVDKEPGVIPGGSGAAVSLQVGIESVFDQIGVAGSIGSDSRSRGGSLVWSGVWFNEPNFGLTAWVRAGCESEAVSGFFGLISSSDCQAVIDPFFEFDQAAFDALMGEDSFALADYFIFRVNENLGQPPVPPDLDRDGIENALDNCPYFPNPDLADANGNGIGNPCECGDQSGDGQVNVLDLIAINLAIFNPSLVTPLCDTDNDGECSVSDIVGANLKVFGQPAYCSRYPFPVP